MKPQVLRNHHHLKLRPIRKHLVPVRSFPEDNISSLFSKNLTQMLAKSSDRREHLRVSHSEGIRMERGLEHPPMPLSLIQASFLKNIQA
jgi:hypothetical protein